MFQPPPSPGATTNHNQHSVLPTPLPIQGPTALVPVDFTANNGNAQEGVQDEGFVQAQIIVQHSQKLQDDLRILGMKIKQHEDNLNRLNTERSQLDDCILHLQATIGKLESSITPKIGNGDNLHPKGDEEVNKQILKHEKSAAGIFCQLKTRHGTQASNLPLTKDVVGIVATLGKVEDDNLCRLLSEFLGVEYMLAIVCRTYEGVKALEMYDNEGFINKSSGLHGLGASIGRALDGRFQVICLESLRPYPGKYVVDDPQRKLDILNPRLPNGESPAGFLGFAVNMINIDSSNLFCVTPSGYGLRETLFYNLFFRLQVYKTRAEMIQALPCISDGALSLDGGVVRSCGVFSLGNREDVHVRFPRPESSMGSDIEIETERQMKDVKFKKEKILEELKRERTLLDMAKFNFNKMKSDFVKFLAHSNSYATQVKLHFTKNALESIAKKAISKNTGARGFRSILESVLVDAMYEIPNIRTGDDTIDAVLVNEEAVGGHAPGQGAKILCGNKDALDRYLLEQKQDSETTNRSGGDHESETELPSIVASM